MSFLSSLLSADPRQHSSARFVGIIAALAAIAFAFAYPKEVTTLVALIGLATLALGLRRNGEPDAEELVEVRVRQEPAVQLIGQEASPETVEAVRRHVEEAAARHLQRGSPLERRGRGHSADQWPIDSQRPEGTQ